MPESIEALVIIVSVVLPGALCGHGYEQRGGRALGSGTERLVLYMALSLALLPVTALASFVVFHAVLNRQWPEDVASLVTALSGRDLFLAIPLVLSLMVVYWGGGMLAASLRLRWLVRRGDVRALLTSDASAFDRLFLAAEYGVVTARLWDGSWLAGIYGSASFASSPNSASDSDLYLEDAVVIDDHGNVAHDAAGWPVSLGRGLLIDRPRIDYLEWIPWKREAVPISGHATRS